MGNRDNPELPSGCVMAEDLAFVTQSWIGDIEETAERISGLAGETFAQDETKWALETAGAVVRAHLCKASFILRDGLVVVECQSGCLAGRTCQ